MNKSTRNEKGGGSFKFVSASRLRSAYESGETDPVRVAETVLNGVTAWDSEEYPMRAFIAQRADDVLEAARESKKRYEKKATLGRLDGIPVAVKDEFYQRGYPITVGTSFLGGSPVTYDATPVAKLRSAGAVLLGKTNMHEVGIGVTGINPHHGPARNPYDKKRITGGSSSGSAAAVAAGFCPIALGADGGGSVRIPAALCGVVGLKPTYGRVSEYGLYPLCWSVGHVGPLAASVEDAALALEFIGGVDEKDHTTRFQPKLKMDYPLGVSLSKLRLGICKDFFDGADEEVKRVCMGVVRKLEEGGAVVVDVDIPHLDLVRPVQYVTIGVEMAAALYELRRDHKTDFGADTRVFLATASSVPAVDYVRAQRLRTRISRAFNSALADIDVLVSPMTSRAAVPIRPDALSDGESDQEVLEAMTAFSFAANITGLPALTVPAGYDGSGMPVGVQLTGKTWSEPTLLGVGAEVERLVDLKRPERHLELLAESGKG